MKKLIAVAAFAAYAACGAQYPLNRVSAVRDMRPVGITEDEANGLIRSYDATNLAERISAKQDALEAGENITIEGNVISADLSGGLPPPGYGMVSNLAVNARQLSDDVARTTEHAEFGQWNLSSFDFADPSGSPHYCRLNDYGTFLRWCIYKSSGGTEISYSPVFYNRRDAEQTVSFVTEGTSYPGVIVTRTVISDRSVAGESFVTSSFVTNNSIIAAAVSDLAGKRGLTDNVLRVASVEILGGWDSNSAFRNAVANFAAREGFVSWTAGLYGRPEWDDGSSRFKQEGYYSVTGLGGSTLAFSVRCLGQEMQASDTNNVTTISFNVYSRPSGESGDFSPDRGVDFTSFRPYRNVGVAGELFVTSSFVDSKTSNAIVSNNSGYVTLDPNPNKLLFGNGNENGLSNLIVNIVKELVDRGELYVTTNGAARVNANWRVTTRTN